VGTYQRALDGGQQQLARRSGAELHVNAENQATGPCCRQDSGSLPDTSSDFLNRRAHPRYAVDEDSNLHLVSHGLSLKSHILDLSLEGRRLRLLEPYSVGKGTRVEVAFKVNGVAFRFAGLIQWTDQNRLAGVHFVDIIARRREQLAEVVNEMHRAAGARAAKELAERAAAAEVEELTRNQATEKPNEQEAVVAGSLPEVAMAKKDQLQKTAQKDRDPRESTLASNAQAHEKRDRRAQARHRVDTTAKVLLVRIGSKLRGQIVDLSMSGCRIRSDERFPVGIYTRVETEFHLEGLPFLLGGVIQTVHDPYNIGIRFLDVSLRKREQLEQLIAEIARQEADRFEAQIGNTASQADTNPEFES
jgi:hypothetical protein